MPNFCYRAVTAILHIVNGTPTDKYSKRQATVETATYGSEFVAARIADDQIVDLRYTLMYLGVPIRSKSFIFGDNKSIQNFGQNVTEVWHIPHFGVYYGRCTMDGSPMGRSEGFSRRWAGLGLPARNTKKNAPSHASGALMVVLPCLDNA